LSPHVDKLFSKMYLCSIFRFERKRVPRKTQYVSKLTLAVSEEIASGKKGVNRNGEGNGNWVLTQKEHQGDHWISARANEFIDIKELATR